LVNEKKIEQLLLKILNKVLDSREFDKAKKTIKRKGSDKNKIREAEAILKTQKASEKQLEALQDIINNSKLSDKKLIDIKEAIKTIKIDDSFLKENTLQLGKFLNRATTIQALTGTHFASQFSKFGKQNRLRQISGTAAVKAFSPLMAKFGIVGLFLGEKIDRAVEGFGGLRHDLKFQSHEQVLELKKLIRSGEDVGKVITSQLDEFEIALIKEQGFTAKEARKEREKEGQRLTKAKKTAIKEIEFSDKQLALLSKKKGNEVIRPKKESLVKSITKKKGNEVIRPKKSSEVIRPKKKSLVKSITKKIKTPLRNILPKKKLPKYAPGEEVEEPLNFFGKLLSRTTKSFKAVGKVISFIAKGKFFKGLFSLAKKFLSLTRILKVVEYALEAIGVIGAIIFSPLLIPIGAVVLALVAISPIIYGVIKRFLELTNAGAAVKFIFWKLVSGVESLVSGVGSLVGWISDILPSAISSVFDLAKDMEKAGELVMDRIALAAKNFYTDIKSVGSWIKNIFSKLFDAIMKIPGAKYLLGGTKKIASYSVDKISSGIKNLTKKTIPYKIIKNPGNFFRGKPLEASKKISKPVFNKVEKKEIPRFIRRPKVLESAPQHSEVKPPQPPIMIAPQNQSGSQGREIDSFPTDISDLTLMIFTKGAMS